MFIVKRVSGASLHCINFGVATEVGCGTGYSTLALLENGHKVIALDKNNECIEKAIEYLDSPETERNGYHAFVCSKCAPSIGYFGYFVAKERLDNRVKEIYERN